MYKYEKWDKTSSEYFENVTEEQLKKDGEDAGIMISKSKWTMDSKHNWFDLEGRIRIKDSMTSLKFMELLDSFGLEFLGVLGYSDTKDEDYDSE